MPIPGGLEPPSADQAPATMRYTARRLPFPLRLSISSTSPEIFEAPPRSHRDDRCFQHTRSRVDSAHTGRLSAVRGGAKVHARFIIETERARVSHHSACLSTPSQVHPSKRSETSCLSSCRNLHHPTDGAIPNPVFSPDSPTVILSTEMVAPAGLEPARIRPHRAAPSCRRTPTLTERNGTTQPPATCVPHSSGSFRGEKCL